MAVYAIGLWLAAEAQATLQAVERISWQWLLGPLVGSDSVAVLVTLALTGWITVTTPVIAVSLTMATAWGGAWLTVLARSHFTFDSPSMAEIG